MIARILLLVGLAGIGWYACARRHRLPIHLVLVLGLLTCAATLLVAPELATRAARMLGVGRGADLAGYVVDALLLFVALHYYTKFIDVEAKLTALTRAIALTAHERE